MTPFAEYLKKIESNLRAGNATEHTHRPALQTLIESFDPAITATNEPKRETCGAPDYIVTKGIIPLGYIETKIVGEPLDVVAQSEQLKRYYSLGNLILTDYLEFRWYVGDKLRMKARLGTVGLDGKLRTDSQYEEDVRQLIGAFLVAEEHFISKPKELVDRMARLARIIRPYVLDTLEAEDESGALRQLMEGFRRVLLHDLTDEQFADMYTQTLCYGLFSARYSHDPRKGPFTRRDASYDIPKTNPFLRDLFAHFNSPDLEDKPYIWAVDDLADLLDRVDIHQVLAPSKKDIRKTDPIIGFYEPFLAAYDKDMRKGRGVYYTPEPVVSYIVRSVDKILKRDFKLRGGLANNSKVTVQGADGEKRECHKVQILDPATGTGTFIYGVINHIYESFAGNQGMWPGYVREHLLPRLFAFELLMAPYAVAHMKLGMLLKDTGYDFDSKERLNVFLTNALEQAFKFDELPFWGQKIAEEANAAGRVKRDFPVMVVLGNPPYKKSSMNQNEWIDGLMEEYKTTVREEETQIQGLSDDYVKFIRFAQWRVESTGYGIVAMITNNGFLDGPLYRDMRPSLMSSFDDIYVLNLHGDSNKGTIPPEGYKDVNVFDIQQGVAITLFVRSMNRKEEKSAIHYADVWGNRRQRYEALMAVDVAEVPWQDLAPSEPYYLFVPQTSVAKDEYGAYTHIHDAFGTGDRKHDNHDRYGAGFVTQQDDFAIAFEPDGLLRNIKEFLTPSARKEDLIERFHLCSTSQWDYARARRELPKLEILPSVRRCLYRPFDFRYTIFDRNVCTILRKRIIRQFDEPNLALLTTRRVTRLPFDNVFAANVYPEYKVASHDRNTMVFPLYHYPEEASGTLFEESPNEVTTREPNIAPTFIAEMETRLGMAFVPDGKGDLEASFGPEDVFSYMYAVFHSPTYRTRYAEFLKMDFPRVPLTSDKALFRNLCALGEELVGLHLMEKVGANLPDYPVALPQNDSAKDRVDEIRYTEPGQGSVSGKVWINKSQYFEGVPMEVWEFHVGGYQVCKRWLNDRKGRTLSYDDLEHYRRIVAALGEPIRLMSVIDAAIDSHGGWPIK